MTCERHVANGIAYTICLRGQRRRAVTCSTCGRATATRLCDGKVPGARGRPRTCSAPLCDGCTTRAGEVDRCPGCVSRPRAAEGAAGPPAQQELFR